MKTIFTISILSLQSILFGQRNMFDFGIEGGINLSTLRGNEIIINNHKAKIGGIAGITAKFNLKKVVSFQTGIYFENKGSRFSLPAVDNQGNILYEINGKENLNGISIPLMLQLSFGEKWCPFVNIGGFYNQFVAIKERLYTKNDFQGSNTDASAYFKKSEFGLSLGIGLRYQFEKPFSIHVEVRNNLGLNNISNLTVISQGTIKSNATALVFGVNYRLEKRTK